MKTFGNVLAARGIYPNGSKNAVITSFRHALQDWADMDIITNPPYKYAKEFVLKALDILHFGCRCYMFLKLTFLEGKTRYNELFKKFPPKSIYVFSEFYALKTHVSTK